MRPKLTPIRAIRANCVYCMGGQAREVAGCPSKDCALFRFRMGRNPNISPDRIRNFTQKTRSPVA